MLVLKRRVGESIIISGNIEVKLLGVRGESARLGISAPPQVPVHREEVLENTPTTHDTAIDQQAHDQVGNETQ